MNEEARSLLVGELERHQERDKQSGNTQRMFEIMNSHYAQLKQNVGLSDALNESEDDWQSEQVFAKLRPASPYRLSELLGRKPVDGKRLIKSDKSKSGIRLRPPPAASSQDIKHSVLQGHLHDSVRRINQVPSSMSEGRGFVRSFSRAPESKNTL